MMGDEEFKPDQYYPGGVVKQLADWEAAKIAAVQQSPPSQDSSPPEVAPEPPALPAAPEPEPAPVPLPDPDLWREPPEEHEEPHKKPAHKPKTTVHHRKGR